jgi:hypothetical protein
MKPHPWWKGKEPKHQREIRENGDKLSGKVEHPEECECGKCKGERR